MSDQLVETRIFPPRVIVALLALALASRLFVFCSLDFLDYVSNKDEHASFEDRIHAYFGKWDAGWYGSIAKNGYGLGDSFTKGAQSRYAFFPVVPLAARGISAITGWKPFMSGSFLSHLAFFGSVFLFYRYCRLSGGSSDTSLWACTLLSFCPHGFIFSAFYTESVFLFLSLLVVNLALSKRFVAGGLIGGILTGTRANGLFVGVYFLWEWIGSQLESKRSGLSVWQGLRRSHLVLLGGALVPLGLFAYWWFCYLDTGDAFAQLNSLSEGWGRRSIAPWANVAQLWDSGHFANRFLVCWAFIMCSGAFVLLFKKLYRDFAYCSLNLVLFLSGSLSQSLLRYMIVLFPIYLGFALVLEKRPVYMALLLALFSITNTLLIYAWYSGNILGI